MSYLNSALQLFLKVHTLMLMYKPSVFCKKDLLGIFIPPIYVVKPHPNLNFIQKRTVGLINNTALSTKVTTLAHKHVVGGLYFRYFQHHCFDDASIILTLSVPARLSPTQSCHCVLQLRKPRTTISFEQGFQKYLVYGTCLFSSPQFTLI